MNKLPRHSDTGRQSDQVASGDNDKKLCPSLCPAAADAGAVKDQIPVKEQAGYQLEAPAHPLSSSPATPRGQGEHGPHIPSPSPSPSACLGAGDSSTSSTSNSATTTTAAISSNHDTYDNTISASASSHLNTSGTTFTNRSTSDSAIAGFSDLPLHLQSSILAHAVAPPRTCKAAAAIKEDPCLLALWLGNKDDTYAWRIWHAALKGKWQVVSQMVSKGFRCEPDDLELSFVLCEAASAGQLEMVQQLLEAGAWESAAWSEPKIVRECSCRPTEWYDCQHWERWRHDDELAGLLEQGHLFISAARNGHTDVCSLLLKQGIHVGVVHDAICAAAAGGHLAVIQRLLQEGSAGLSQLADVRNAMFTAAAAGHLDVVQFFLGQGADLYSFRGTPWAGDSDFTSCLEAAAAGGNPELLQLLINHYGMAVEPDWPKVLEAAVTSGNDKAVHVLLIAAAVEGGDGEVGSSSAHLTPSQPPQAVQQEAIQQFQQRQQQQQQEVQQILAECVRSLLQLQSLLPPWAKLDAALLMAARLGHLKVVILLLNCGGRRFSRQLFTAALQVAASKGHSDLIPVLIWHSADVNAESRGTHSTVPELDGSYKSDSLFPDGDQTKHLYTPLGQALLGGHWAAAELLMAWGAKTWDQFLAFAIYKRAPAPTVQLLLDKGVRDSDGHAGIYAAAHNGQQDVVELLLGVQHSASCDTPGCRLQSALFGATLGHQPQVVDHLCSALRHAQGSGCVAAADRQDILNIALLFSAKTSKYYVQRVPVLQPAPAAIHPEGGQELPAAGVGQAVDDIPAEQHQQLDAQAVHTFQLVKRLHPASEDHVRVVRLLLQHGADPDHEHGQVLAEAVRRQYEEGARPWYGGERQDHAILRELLKAGASDVQMALTAAAETGDAAAVPKLVAATQGPVDPAGKALLAAAAHNTSSVVSSLIDSKANVAAALSAAAAANNVQAATMILQHPQVRVTDQGLKQQLADMAARSQSFSLLWALSKAVGMLDDCVLTGKA